MNKKELLKLTKELNTLQMNGYEYLSDEDFRTWDILEILEKNCCCRYSKKLNKWLVSF